MAESARKTKEHSIDYPGAIFIALTLIPLLLSLVWGGSKYDWSSWQIIMLLCLCVLFLAVFMLVERKAKEPIISLSLFKNRVFLVSILMVMLSSMSMYGAILYIPTFAQGVVGVSATNSGMTLTPMMLTLIVASILSGQIISRTGKYKVMTIIGMAFGVTGMFLFTRIGISTTNTSLSIQMVILGLGLGLLMPIFNIAVQNAFERERLGEVTAGVQLLRGIGGTIGSAVLGGVMNSQLASRISTIQSEPFVQTMKQLNPKLDFSQIDANYIQQFLGSDFRTQITSIIAKASAAVQTQLTASFNHFFNTVKVVFSEAVDRAFLVGAIVMSFALVLSFFLPELPLRKTNDTDETNINIEEQE